MSFCAKPFDRSNGDLPENFDLSRSLKVIGTDTDRSTTYDFLLVTHSNYGSISYHFRDKRQYLQKISHPLHLTFAEGVLLGIL